MKPSQLKPGQQVLVGERVAYFVRRDPSQGSSRKALNWFRFPDLAGFNCPTDLGICSMSDYDVSRMVRFTY